MKPSLLAVAALMVITIGIAQADYIVIKVNMGIHPSTILAPADLPKFGPGGFMPPAPKPPPAPPTDKDGKPLPPREVNKLINVVFLEFSKAQMVNPLTLNPPPAKGIFITKIHHRWGDTFVINDQKFIEIAPLQNGVPAPIKRPTVMQLYQDKLKDVGAKTKSPAKLLELAEFALTHGLVKQCADAMEELSKANPGPPEQAAVKAFTKVREDLARPLTRDEPAVADWSTLLSYKVTSSNHYSLLYDGIGKPEVAGRLDRLEKNMEAFYYWFALKGKVLPMPERRLAAVLIDKPEDFRQTRKACDDIPLVADGFYGRRDNLVVFSANRLDLTYEPLGRLFNQLIQGGWDLKNIMNPKLAKPPPRTVVTPQEMAAVHTVALIKKALEEESEIATTSHQGSRQLLAAIGMLPRSVQIPEWIQFGWASFFETPKFDPETHTGAFWPGTGAPSWTYLTQWKIWEAEKGQLDDAPVALRNVLTDIYFRQSQAGPFIDLEALWKARTYAWALSYYLSQRQLDGLIRYGQELSQLPRDLEFDQDVHVACFARAFGLTDPNKFAHFASDWYKFMGIEPLPMPEILQEAQKVLREKRMKAALEAK